MEESVIIKILPRNYLVTIFATDVYLSTPFFCCSDGRR